jgi:hypothetical protein
LEWRPTTAKTSASDAVRRCLPDTLARFRHVVVATHVPPPWVACWHAERFAKGDIRAVKTPQSILRSKTSGPYDRARAVGHQSRL